MRTVGLLGGMSWQSTQIYYKLINEDVQARKGGLHSAPLLIKSFDFAEIETLQHRGSGQMRAGYWKNRLRRCRRQGLRL